MTTLYLIAHKVRGEPAFDIAQRMPCPLCTVEHDEIYDKMVNPPGPHRIGNCDECEDDQYWWIIPTSGHRAFPYWHAELDSLHYASPRSPKIHPIEFEALVDAMPLDLRDHYLAEREVARSLIDTLGLIHRPLAPIKRRM